MKIHVYTSDPISPPCTGIDEPLALSRGGQTYYYVTDALGSVTGVTNAAGAVQNARRHWGQACTRVFADTSDHPVSTRVHA